MNIKLPAMRLGGRFRAVVSKDAECKQVVEDTGFFDNLITNTGMNRVGEVTTNAASSTSSFNSLCGRFVVGSGSAEPQFTDTALQNPVAFASSNSALDNDSSNYERGWYEMTVRHQFGQGQETVHTGHTIQSVYSIPEESISVGLLAPTIKRTNT